MSKEREKTSFGVILETSAQSQGFRNTQYRIKDV
jgi:hypothetical protein